MKTYLYYIPFFRYLFLIFMKIIDWFYCLYKRLIIGQRFPLILNDLAADFWFFFGIEPATFFYSILSLLLG